MVIIWHFNPGQNGSLRNFLLEKQRRKIYEMWPLVRWFLALQSFSMLRIQLSRSSWKIVTQHCSRAWPDPGFKSDSGPEKLFVEKYPMHVQLDRDQVIEMDNLKHEFSALARHFWWLAIMWSGNFIIEMKPRPILWVYGLTTGSRTYLT